LIWRNIVSFNIVKYIIKTHTYSHQFDSTRRLSNSCLEHEWISYPTARGKTRPWTVVVTHNTIIYYKLLRGGAGGNEYKSIFFLIKARDQKKTSRFRGDHIRRQRASVIIFLFASCGKVVFAKFLRFCSGKHSQTN